MIGKTISHYKILEELGRGGMGVVYKAEDTKLQRRVALKFLPPELSRDDDARRRFLHEARAASSLQHENICTIHEIEETEEHVFIAMEYIEGQSLEERVIQGPLKLEEAVDIAIQIAQGLSEAHGKGIVHRDIKPANIMLTPRGKAKITDFGLAVATGMTRLTKEGTTVGTVAYMSPEQGGNKETDRRSDIWSLGAVLYEMVAGRRPFDGEYDQAVIYSILNEKHAPLTGLRSDVPLELERIIDKCLEKNPAERYQHSDELIVDLRRLIRELPGAAVTGKAASRRVSPLSITATILLVAAITVAAYFMIKRLPDAGQDQPEPVAASLWENSIAVLPFRDLSPSRDQEYFCDGMTDAVNDRLSKHHELKVIATTSVMRYRETSLDIKAIGAELGVKNIVEGTVQREGNRIRVRAQLINAGTGFHLWSDTYDEMLESVFDVQDRISTAIARALEVEITLGGCSTPPIIAGGNLEAYEYYMKGMHFICSKYVIYFDEDDFQAGVEMFERALELDSTFAMAFYGLAWAYEHHYQVTQNTQYRTMMSAAVERAYRIDSESAYANALMAYNLYEYKQEYDEAFRHLQSALAINPNIGQVNFLVGTCLLYYGLYNKALPYLHRSQELDPYYFWTPYKLAVCYMNTGELEKAANQFEKYFELAPVVLIFPGKYIALKIKMGQLDEVSALIHRIEEMYPHYGGLPYCRALLHAARGEHKEALAMFKNSEAYALLDMKDEALAALESEIRGTASYPYIFYLDLSNNPIYENLRGDRRFEALVEREKRLYEEAETRLVAF